MESTTSDGIKGGGIAETKTGSSWKMVAQIRWSRVVGMPLRFRAGLVFGLLGGRVFNDTRIAKW